MTTKEDFEAAISALMFVPEEYAPEGRGVLAFTIRQLLSQREEECRREGFAAARKQSTKEEWLAGAERMRFATVDGYLVALKEKA